MERRGLVKLNSHKSNEKIPDALKYILKSEDDLVNILKMCEPLTVIQSFELEQLADNTTLNSIRIYLLEKKEEYVKCL